MNPRETVSALLLAHASAMCACGRGGLHAVCPACGVHADRAVGACPCIDARDDRPADLRPFTASTLTPWDLEFLASCESQLSRKRSKGLSEKQAAVLAKIAARAAAPSTRKATAERDALDVSPKRGRTWAAMVKACRFSLVKCIGQWSCNHLDDNGRSWSGSDATPHVFDPSDLDTRACPVCGKARAFYVERLDMHTNPSREIVAAVREDIRAQIADVTGWDKLPDADAFSDAMRVLPAKHPIAKVLASLLDWHRYAVNVGILTVAA